MSGTQKPIQVVAIDGPAGSGKSTVARRFATLVGLEYLDTGAMYRAVTYAVLTRHGDPEDAAFATQVAAETTIVFTADGGVVVNGVDVTVEIRGKAVSAAVSAVASHPGVREKLVSQQREWVHHRGGGVLEGRDIGTAVFPDALLKVYITASPQERARRRALQDGAKTATKNAPDEQEYAQVLTELNRRDQFDSNRAYDPLKQADDATIIDTTDVTIAGVVTTLKRLFDQRLSEQAGTESRISGMDI